MPKKKYIVTLAEAEREQVQQLLRSGKHQTRKITRARILLKAAEGGTDQQIALSLGVGRQIVFPDWRVILASRSK
jgi:DNA-directed RNA polymerase sigma subunit (sigma70/sigma32)